MQRFHAVWSFLKEVLSAFSEDQVPFLAAAVSYFVFFSFFPLLLGLIAIAGYVLAPEEASQRVIDFFTQGAPGQEQFLRTTLQAVVEARGSIGLFALAILLWSGKNIFVSLANALDMIAHTPPPRGLGYRIRRHLVGVGFAIAIGGAMLVLAALHWLVITILHFEIPVAGIRPQDIPGVVPLLLNVLPVGLIGMSLFTLYRFLPVHRASPLAITMGALVAAVLWEILRRLFGWYLETFGRFNEVYGPASSVIVFLLWLYLSAITFLLGGEVVCVFDRRATKAARREG